jgi:predicted MPP superfamily phosphohydrolase
MSPQGSKGTEAKKGVSSLSRRGFLKTLGISTLSITAAGLLGYGYVFHIEPEWLSVEQIQAPIAELSASLQGFRIVCLSDLHFEPFTRLDFIHRVVRRVNALEPDLICLLGDYVFAQADSIHELAPVLAELHADHGVFAILGNHDLWTDAEVVRAGLEAEGIQVLVNQRVLLNLAGETIVLAGLDDGWSGKPDLQQALEGAPENAPVILLLHEPDLADQIALDGRVDLQLSGHSHGGQMRIPFFGAPFLPEYARKYDQGFYQVKDMWLYVTRGIGVIYPPGRFNCRPEITEITLVTAAQ